MSNQPMPASFFQTGKGSEPVREWLLSLPAVDRKIIGDDIRTVQFGWPIGMPLVRKMDTDLWEVRCNINSGIARVFFTVIDNTLYLLHGIVKKSQTTPKQDLDLAKQRLKQLRKQP